MAKDPKQETPIVTGKNMSAQDKKALALKSALRANLQKRKAQSRAKASQADKN